MENLNEYDQLEDRTEICDGFLKILIKVMIITALYSYYLLR